MVNSLLLKGVDSDPIHDCASFLSLPSGLGCSLSWACSVSWTIKTGFCFSALSAGLLNLTSLVELSTIGHEPYHGHNYTWHIRDLNLSQVPEGGCSFSGSELQDCLEAPTEPQESDVPAPKRCGVVENVCHQAKEPWKGFSGLHSIRNNKEQDPAGWRAWNLQVYWRRDRNSLCISSWEMDVLTVVKAGSWWLLAPGERFLFLRQICNCQIGSLHWKKTWLEALSTAKHQTSTWRQQVIVMGTLTPAGDRGLHLSFCFGELCCFWVALIRDVMEGLPRCLSPSRLLNPAALPLEH